MGALNFELKQKRQCILRIWEAIASDWNIWTRQSIFIFDEKIKTAYVIIVPSIASDIGSSQPPPPRSMVNYLFFGGNHKFFRFFETENKTKMKVWSLAHLVDLLRGRYIYTKLKKKKKNTSLWLLLIQPDMWNERVNHD